MQDYLSEKTIALVIKGTKITTEALEQAVGKFLKETKNTVDKAVTTGKQSLKTLQKSGVSLSSVEITKDNIGDFGKVAKKYGIDYSLMKQDSAENPAYYVFFKGKDAEVLDAAFNEFASRKYAIDDRAGLKGTLEKVSEQKQTKEKSKLNGHDQTKEKIREIHRQRKKVLEKDMEIPDRVL